MTPGVSNFPLLLTPIPVLQEISTRPNLADPHAWTLSSRKLRGIEAEEARRRSPRKYEEESDRIREKNLLVQLQSSCLRVISCSCPGGGGMGRHIYGPLMAEGT